MRRLVDRGLALREVLVTHPAMAWQRHIWVRRMLRGFGYLICFGLLADVGWRALRNFSVAHVSMADLALASVAAVVSWVALACGWVALSRDVAGPRLASWNWVRTQLLRYIPGAVWGPAARAKTSPTRLRRGVALVLAEQALSLGFAVLLGSAILGVAANPLWGAGAAGAALGLLVLIVFAGKFGIRPKVAAAATGIYAVSYCAYALAAVAAQRALGPEPSPARVAGAAVLAWVVGVVVVTAPGGLGAREAFYVALLDAIMPASHAPLSAGAVISRLVMMLAEVLVFVAVAAAWRWWPGRRGAPLAAGAGGTGLPEVADLAGLAEGPLTAAVVGSVGEGLGRSDATSEPSGATRVPDAMRGQPGPGRRPDRASPDRASPDRASPDRASPDFGSPDFGSPAVASPDEPGRRPAAAAGRAGLPDPEPVYSGVPPRYAGAPVARCTPPSDVVRVSRRAAP